MALGINGRLGFPTLARVSSPTTMDAHTLATIHEKHLGQGHVNNSNVSFKDVILKPKVRSSRSPAYASSVLLSTSSSPSSFCVEKDAIVPHVTLKAE